MERRDLGGRGVLPMGHGDGKKDDQKTKKVLHISAILLQNRESGIDGKKSRNGTIFSYQWQLSTTLVMNGLELSMVFV